jgi:hypothetical protein
MKAHSNGSSSQNFIRTLIPAIILLAGLSVLNFSNTSFISDFSNSKFKENENLNKVLSRLHCPEASLYFQIDAGKSAKKNEKKMNSEWYSTVSDKIRSE